MSRFDALWYCFYPGASAGVTGMRIRVLCILVLVNLLLAGLIGQALLKSSFPFDTEFVVVAIDHAEVQGPRPTLTISRNEFGETYASGKIGDVLWGGHVVVTRDALRVPGGEYRLNFVRNIMEAKFLKVWNSDMRWRKQAGALVIESSGGTMHLLRK